MMAATQWQARSVRGFISGQLGKRMGLPVESFRRDGDRVYRGIRRQRNGSLRIKIPPATDEVALQASRFAQSATHSGAGSYRLSFWTLVVSKMGQVQVAECT
jgi:hypothetical protein